MDVVNRIMARLKDELRSKQITQRKLADRVKLPRSTFNRHLNTGHIRLCDYLKAYEVLGIECPVVLSDKEYKLLKASRGLSGDDYNVVLSVINQLNRK